MSKNSLFWLIISLIAVKTLLFTVVLPPWQGPDEPFHFKMAYVFADPMTDIQKLDIDVVSSLQQHRFREYTDDTQPDDTIPKLSKHKLMGYYALLGMLFGPFANLSLTEKMFLGRLFSAAYYLIIVGFVYLLSRRMFTGSEGYWVSLGAVSFVGLQPQYSFFSITLNSDNLISFLLTVILCCIVCIASRKRDTAESSMHRYWLWSIAIFAVLMGLFVKRTAMVGVMLFFLSIPIVMYKGRRSLILAGPIVAVLLTLIGCFVFFSGSAQEQRDPYFNQFSIRFDGVPGNIKVSYQAFDIDSKREVAVLLNGENVGNVKRTKNNKWGPIRSLVLPDKLVTDDTSNILTFDNVRNPPRRDRWGVRKVHINGILTMEAPQGNIPRSRIFDNLTQEEKKQLEKELEPSIVSKWSAKIGKATRNGLVKARNVSEVSPHLIVRFFLVQFVSFWFSLGWMIYKMSLGWYFLFGLVTLFSLAGLVRLMYAKFRNSGFEFINMKVVGLLILLFGISLVAMLIAVAMGRCRFMEIAAISVLIPLGLWALAPAPTRNTVMKAFVCFMVFLNVVSVFQYMIPIFYL
jgi:hypothetical protein